MSVAVLDFQNLSRDSADAWLGVGLSGELTSRLGQVSRLTVASRAAVQRLRNPASMRLADVGRSLNAVYLVNGSVQRSGPRLRVTVELVRAATGTQVWTDQFDRTETDLLAIQEAVASAVAAAVTGRLLPAERAVLGTTPTRNAEAYAAYVRGLALREVTGVRTSEWAALAAFERAVSLDSLFADAWAALALANARLYWEYADRSETRVERARVAAKRARTIAPDAAATHVALGYYHYFGRRDFGRALTEFAAALVREPNNATVQVAFANVARRQGDFERSLVGRTRALEIDPENIPGLVERALTYTWMRRFEEAERDLARALSLDPRHASDLYAMEAFISRDGTTRRAASRSAAIAADAPGLTARTFEDPEVVLPLLRLADDIQSAVLRMSPPDEPLARAGFFVSSAVVLAARHRDREAGESFDSARANILRLLDGRPTDDRYHAVLSFAYAGLTDCPRALAEGHRATELLPIEVDAMSGAVDLLLLAQVETTCGRADEATAHLETLMSRPAPITVALLRSDPVWTPLRGNPRFERLVAQNGR